MKTFLSNTITLSCTTALLVLVGGCSAPENESNGLFLSGSLEPPAMRDTVSEVALPQDESSLDHGMNRSHWPRVELRVPQAAVGVYPNFTTTALRNPRHNGNFPTANNAFDGGSSFGTLLLDVPVDLGFVFYDAVALPVRVFITPPWKVIQEPAGDFQLLQDTPTDTP